MPPAHLTQARAPHRARGSRRAVRAAMIATAAALAVAALAAVWFLGGEAPEAVDITAATAQVAGGDAAADEAAAAVDDTGTGAVAGATAAARGGDISGVWQTDPTIGAFSVSESAGTFAGVRIVEVLASVGETTAVVRTPDVSGTVELDGTTLTTATVEVDMATLVSDEPRREDAVQRALDTGTHPTATFVLSDPVDLRAVPTEEEPVEVTVTGDLTIHGLTRRVEVPLQVTLVDGVAVITGTFDLAFSDYDVQVPSAPVFVSVEDEGIVELELFLTRSG